MKAKIECCIYQIYSSEIKAKQAFQIDKVKRIYLNKPDLQKKANEKVLVIKEERKIIQHRSLYLQH